MQKFVVGPGIGGAHLTWYGAKTLVFKYGLGIDPLYGLDEGMLFESHGQVGINDCFSPLLSAWWECYHTYNTSDAFEQLEDDDSISLQWGPGSDMRKMLIPFIESMEGDYAEFDSANDDCMLRVVEVPDGYQCIVMEDPEMGCETVQEVARMWPVPDDGEWKDILSVRKFCRNAEMHPEEPILDMHRYECRGVTLLFTGDYGVARRKNGDFMFLEKSTYYRATEDHGKECFEIVGDRPNRFRMDRPVHGAEAVLAYMKLVKYLEDNA